MLKQAVMVFNIVMRIVSAVLGLLMVAMGGVWILQGLNIAFLNSFMAGEPKWAAYGAILALFGIGQIIWSNTRQSAYGALDPDARPR